MLLSFRVANHKSFRDQQELLLLPAYDKSRPATSVAAIYGANASGKSNLLDALSFMRTAVLDSFIGWRPTRAIPRSPFKLGTDGRRSASSFGVDVLIDDEKYVYGFSVDDERVTEEWLYHYPRGRRRVLFERERDTFRFGDKLRGPLATVEGVTRSNSLFLSAAAQHGLTQLAPVYRWFDLEIESIDPLDRSGERERVAQLLEDEEGAKRVLRLMRAADLGITDIRVDEDQVPPPTGDGKVDVVDLLARGYEIGAVNISLPRVSSTEQMLERALKSTQATRRVLFEHRVEENPGVLELAEESRGTRAWFDSLGAIIDVLDHGHLMVVDELDTSLHPLLVREFVRLFKDPETNPNGAQLVFTTHDTSLLARQQGEELLERDEIWFTEKDESGASTIFPLTDFKPRTGLNWERRYLGGAVGAVPFLDRDDFADAVGGERG